MSVDLKINENYHPELKRFLKDVYELVQQNHNEKTITREVGNLLKPLLQVEGFLDERFREPNSERSKVYNVYVAPDKSFSIASAVWNPGQGTPIHDHCTWGIIGVVQGVEIETHYHQPDGYKKEPLKCKEVHILQKGEVLVCCTTDQDIHDVRGGYSGEPCVGFHVYGGDLAEIDRHVYNPLTGERKAMKTAWEYPQA
ncbi:cysteine dioxygenase type I [Neobacillus bataviensis LMG 21833]|uniref:Cysteine dioxygenase type I n=1 Tax=Neobacillus bataviensis LMG 21833 TaxID=1117379 RepID=K6DDQ3_9BACI|nr:cysteine dioxygenase family protein [Neobacillus bataviensis]EKN70652.1 cysteine dioxygenase type I [Neobacillus bataviensis LMG 21833]